MQWENLCNCIWKIKLTNNIHYLLVTEVISITMHSCWVKYFQNTDFTDDKPNSSRSKMTKSRWIFCFLMEECKVTLSKTNAAYLTYHFLMKRWSLILNDAKRMDQPLYITALKFWGKATFDLYKNLPHQSPCILPLSTANSMCSGKMKSKQL